LSTHRHPTTVGALALSVLAAAAALAACGSSSSGTAAVTSSTTTVSAETATSAAASTAAAATSSSSTRAARTASTSVAQQSTTKSASSSEEPTGPVASKYSHAEVVAIETLAHCVRAHGVAIQPPNFSGTGEVFTTNGINTKSPQYRSAMEGCEGDILAILKAAGGAKSNLVKVGGAKISPAG
jgi:hypothetical protein